MRAMKHDKRDKTRKHLRVKSTLQRHNSGHLRCRFCKMRFSHGPALAAHEKSKHRALHRAVFGGSKKNVLGPRKAPPSASARKR